jgi:hypothetical protein
MTSFRILLSIIWLNVVAPSGTPNLLCRLSALLTYKWAQ